MCRLQCSNVDASPAMLFSFFTVFLNKKERTEKRSRLSKRKSGPNFQQKGTRYF